MVMKAKELMQGDYVSFVDKDTKVPIVVRVEYIEDDWCDVSWIIKGTIIRTHRMVKTENLKPVVITTDMMEKNGFRRDGFFVLAEKRYLDKDGFCKIVWMDGSIQTFIPFSKDNVRLCDCVYWHQLQNALRTFGVEKKIKL